MAISKELIRKYAELIVRTGVNVQPGQIVQLSVSVEQHEFVRRDFYRTAAVDADHD